MSSLHSDGSIERDAIEVASQVAARVNRAAQDTKAENAQLKARVDQVERLIAQINQRLDALEALGEILLDEPIPFQLPEVA